MDVRNYLLAQGVHPGWLPAFEPLTPALTDLLQRIADERAAGMLVQPAESLVFRALRVDPASVRVVILGQDPYPGPGHAVGLAFSVPPELAPLPPSLRNIFKELTADIGCAMPATGDLSSWEAQGVLLLNTVLTVRTGQRNSHADYGWQTIVGALLAHLAVCVPGVVAILWGKPAQQFAPFLAGAQILATAHPSPLAAHRGFFGSRVFSKANKLLKLRGFEPVAWCLPSGQLFSGVELY